MSYTMTFEAPAAVAAFERVRAEMSSAEFGELFLDFLSQRMRCMRKREVKESLPPVTQSLAGVARNVDFGNDDHGILARGMLEKYERISS